MYRKRNKLEQLLLKFTIKTTNMILICFKSIIDKLIVCAHLKDVSPSINLTKIM